MCKMSATFIVCLGLALTIGSKESFGKSGAAHSGRSASTHSTLHPSAARSLRHHQGRRAGWALWPTTGGFYGINQGSQQLNGEQNTDATRSISEHITYTYDVPWDAVHRYPPAVRVYEVVAGCHSETVTVPRAAGEKQSINIVRCY